MAAHAAYRMLPLYRLLLILVVSHQGFLGRDFDSDSTVPDHFLPLTNL